MNFWPFNKQNLRENYITFQTSVTRKCGIQNKHHEKTVDMLYAHAAYAPTHESTENTYLVKMIDF